MDSSVAEVYFKQETRNPDRDQEATDLTQDTVYDCDVLTCTVGY
jgi:hypothetical protein